MIASMPAGAVAKQFHIALPSGFSAMTWFILSSHRSPSHHQQTFSVASSGVAASTSTDRTTVIRTFCFTFYRSFLFFFFGTIGHGAATMNTRHEGGKAKDEEGDDDARCSWDLLFFW